MMTSSAEEILEHLKSLANPDNVKGMARFGINPTNTLGVSIPTLRGLARSHRRDHALAAELWSSGVHEARILAAFVDDPKQVTEKQMQDWAQDFDSWDICDQVCGSLFDQTVFAHRKALQWSRRSEEFMKRAGFVLMASLAVHDKKSGDEAFEKFLPAILRQAVDERNFVRKAVNWALRQIGKRNKRLYGKALKVARRLSKSESKPARWVGRDARRELENTRTVGRIRK